jgi:hypothetical protein
MTCRTLHRCRRCRPPIPPSGAAVAAVVEDQMAESHRKRTRSLKVKLWTPQFYGIAPKSVRLPFER